MNTPPEYPLASPLLTDLYQLTMLQGYFNHKLQAQAVFEFFVRQLPPCRRFLLAAGLQQVLDYIQNLRFSAADLRWLRASGRFSGEFIDALAAWSFTGDVYAMAEGTVFFANEPILRVVAPLPQAQLLESRIINILQYQTLVASKAARVVLAAPDKLLIDFGLRRAHGAEAGLYAARASYLAGFAGSSTVLAEPVFGIPVYGTMAHSFVQAHTRELDAFRHFAQTQADNVVLLIDTYDTAAAARKVVTLAEELRPRGIQIRAVRIDSGNLAEEAARVRAILDAGGLAEIKIFSSGNVDEYLIDRLQAVRAPIDGYGVGTHMDTSSDAPYLDCAYKLQEYAGTPRRKYSPGKLTWPGRKQVFRRYDDRGEIVADCLTVDGDTQPGTPLLTQYMAGGRPLRACESLATLRTRAQCQLATLPANLRSRSPGASLTVDIAPALRTVARQTDASCADRPARIVADT